MYVGARLAGKRMLDAVGRRSEAVVVDSDGWGTFQVDGGSVSVWVTQEAQAELFIHLPVGA